MMMLPLACTEEGTPSGGNGNGGGNEMADCVCPESVRAGKDAVLQWEGFLEGDSLVAVSEEGDEYELEVSYVTSSGMGFSVPVDVPAGRYMLVLERDERIELGEVEITAPVMPVTGLSVPASALAGETVLIGGVGYKQGCMVVLTDSEGAESELTATLTNEGISVVLPEEMPVGQYDVYLLQDNLKWLLKEGFSVLEEEVVAVDKELAEMRYYSPYVGEQLLMISWKIESGDTYTLTHSENIVTGDQIDLNAEDIYVSTGAYSFELSYDGYELSDNYEFTYNYADGLISYADIVRYNGKTIRYEWQYDSEGYMTEIVTPSLTLCTINYEAGNVVAFDGVSYEYGNQELKNSPCAPDVTWAYKAINEWAKPVMVFPYLLGWYDKASSLLPTKMFLPDVSTAAGGNIECPLTYEFDSDGYVTEMSWSEGSDAHSIEFIYR